MNKSDKIFFIIKKNWIFILLLILLISITFFTSYEGSIDVGDYSDVAKYFSGDLNAKIRSSHSYLYGFLISPLVGFFGSFIALKILSLIFLLLIVYSVYLATGKNRKSFWLMFLSPIFWYMAPWTNPIQLASLLFLWGYIFMKKYDKEAKIKFLLLSGILIGLSFGFWDGALFFIIIFAISFFYNKKLTHFFLFIIFLFVGFLPKLILDNHLFNFAFMGIIRYLAGILTAKLFRGIYGTMEGASSFLIFIAILMFIPFLSYKLISKENWKNNKKTLIFLLLSLIIIFKSPQLRYLLLLTPIIILELIPKITEEQFKKQIIIFSIISLVVIAPYIIQINNSTNSQEFSSLLSNFGHIEIYQNQEQLIQDDLQKIIEEFPDEIFVVGNGDSDYQRLAHIYWGDKVKEFVSIQDYNLVIKNQSVLFEKTFTPTPNIQNRRQIFISGGISKNENDNTNYNSIKYAIAIEEPLELQDFYLIRKYTILNLYKKK